MTFNGFERNENMEEIQIIETIKADTLNECAEACDTNKEW